MTWRRSFCSSEIMVDVPPFQNPGYATEHHLTHFSLSKGLRRLKLFKVFWRFPRSNTTQTPSPTTHRLSTNLTTGPDPKRGPPRSLSSLATPMVSKGNLSLDLNVGNTASLNNYISMQRCCLYRPLLFEDRRGWRASRKTTQNETDDLLCSTKFGAR